MDYEELLDEADKQGIIVHERYDFNSKAIKGLYCNKNIALSKRLHTDAEKASVLAEELGHYHTTAGNIIDTEDIGNRKQEQTARRWAYDHQIGLIGIIEASKRGCRSVYEMAEHLQVSEDFLREALEAYRQHYGQYAKVDNYVVFFEPRLAVMRALE